MSRFINIDMNIGNARMTYIVKRREYICLRIARTFFTMYMIKVSVNLASG